MCGWWPSTWRPRPSAICSPVGWYACTLPPWSSWTRKSPGLATFRTACEETGRTADPQSWRVARTIFVADDDKTAAAYGGADPRSPYRFYYHQLFTKLKKGKLKLIEMF